MYKVALGYDLHRLKKENNSSVVCGGVDIVCDLMIDGAHSDGDVVYHAITDALLSPMGTDIGLVFPNTDPLYKDKKSNFFVSYAYNLVQPQYSIMSIDIVVICDKPKISPYALAIRENIATLLEMSIEDISIRGKTTEGTRPLTIEAYANVLFQKK